MPYLTAACAACLTSLVSPIPTVLKAVPFGSTKLEVVEGGLSVRGLHVPELGEGDTIVVAVAALTVYVDVPE